MVSRKEREGKIMKVKRKIKTNGRNKDIDGKTLIHQLKTTQRKVKKKCVQSQREGKEENERERKNKGMEERQRH